MTYDFIELGELSCAEVARGHRPLLLGRVAVCTSFDSGCFLEPAWLRANEYCVTPPIDERLIDNWPVSHEAYCDEWWVFEAVVPVGFKVNAFCNYVDMRIANYRDLVWENGCPLDSYLAAFHPVAVFGNNEYAYLIRRTPRKWPVAHAAAQLRPRWASSRNREELGDPSYPTGRAML